MKIMEQSQKFHIYGEDCRSLCGRWGAFQVYLDKYGDELKGTETWKEGDCKSCFKKAIKLGVLK